MEQSFHLQEPREWSNGYLEMCQPCHDDRRGTVRVRCARPIDLCPTTLKQGLFVVEPCLGERHGTVRVRGARPIVTSSQLDLIDTFVRSVWQQCETSDASITGG